VPDPDRAAHQDPQREERDADHVRLTPPVSGNPARMGGTSQMEEEP